MGEIELSGVGQEEQPFSHRIQRQQRTTALQRAEQVHNYKRILDKDKEPIQRQ
jgi:hypothetical protein